MRPCKVRVRAAGDYWVLTIDGEGRLVLNPPPPPDPVADLRHHLEHLLGDIFI
jgi:hypothetical protein